MEVIGLREATRSFSGVSKKAQTERIIITRHGKPFLMLVGIDGMDWEDLYWGTNRELWKTIQEQRALDAQGEKGVPLEEVRRQLGI
ncbi:type II toxin-antitoxin system Phd/YefM family antitoxin [Planctomycetota bacterium]